MWHFTPSCCTIAQDAQHGFDEPEVATYAAEWAVSQRPNLLVIADADAALEDNRAGRSAEDMHVVGRSVQQSKCIR